MKKVIIAGIALLGFATAQAQTDGGVRTATQTATVVLEQVLDIAITTDNLTAFTFNEVSEYDNGITQTGATTFEVNASVPWNIHFAADADEFAVTSGSSSTTMPLSVFSIGKTGGSLQTLTNAASTNPLNSGARGDDETTGNTFTVDYKANPGYDYDPATYEVGITYTISAQ